MKKIKLKNSTCMGNSLSREELKQVFGGTTGSTTDCKTENDPCSFTNSQGVTEYGKCKFLPFSYHLVCWVNKM